MVAAVFPTDPLYDCSYPALSGRISLSSRSEVTAALSAERIFSLQALFKFFAGLAEYECPSSSWL